jgi:hypothetical protein
LYVFTTAAHSIADTVIRKFRLSIAVHTTAHMPEFLDPQTALVTAGVETDVLGIDRDSLSSEGLAAITAAHDQISSIGCCARSTTAKTPPARHFRKRQR